MMNPDQISARLSMMDDAALQKFAELHKNDPYVLPLAVTESNRRKQVRAAAQARQAQQAQQPPVADAAIAQMQPEPEPAPIPPQQMAAGIPQLAARNLESMADGGIAGYAAGGVTKEEREKYRAYAMNRARQLGIDPKFVDAVFQTESGYNPNAKSKTGPVGIGQLTRRTARALGLDPYERRDPYKNMDASMSLMQQLFRKYKDPAKVAIAYNQGEGVLNDHLKQNKGQLVPEKLYENVRTANKQEPFNYLKKISSYAGLPALNAARPVASTKPKPKREEFVGLSPDLAKQITEALPMASAQAADEVPRIPAGYTRSADGRTISGPVTKPTSAAPVAAAPVAAAPAAPKPAPKPAPRAAAAAEDIIYDPMTGAPIAGGVANQEGPQSEAPVTSLLTGTADLLLGIPEAVTNVVTQDYYFATGKNPTEARIAAENNPVVKAAGYLRSGKWFGVENDPAYRKDPLSIIAALPSMGVDEIAEKFNLDKDGAQLALNNALLIAPVIGKVKQVQYNMPKLPGKEPPNIAAADAQAAVKAGLDEVRAAEKKLEAPRLGMSTGETPGVIRGTTTGESILPTGEAAARQKAGLTALAQDQLSLAAAKRKLAEAEATAAAASKAPGTRTLGERFGALPFAGRAAVPYGVLSASTDVSGASDAEETAPPVSDVYPDFRGSVADEMRRGPGATPAAPAAKTDKVDNPFAEKKKAGFDDDDLLMLGLGLLASPGGQPGGEVSQLFSNVGRAGLGAIAAKREREKTADEQMYRTAMTQYYTQLAKMQGRPEMEEREIARVIEENPGMTRLQAIEAIAKAKYDPRGDVAKRIAEMKQQGLLGMLQGGDTNLAPSSPAIDALVNKYTS